MIAPVPVHCFSITFIWPLIDSRISYSHEYGHDLGVHCYVSNCSKSLTMSAVLPIVGTVFGPHTLIEYEQGALKQCQNLPNVGMRRLWWQVHNV